MSETVQPDGIVEGFLVRVFGRSYRTTIAGIVAVVATVVPFLGLSADVVSVCHALAGLAAGGGLLIAKDQSVSGKP